MSEVFKMKLIIEVFLISFPIFEAATYLEDRKQLISSDISVCICATGVDPFLVQQWADKVVFPIDPCFKCFIKCISVNMGGFNRDGTYNVDYIIRTTQVSPAVVQNCIAKATNITDLCHKAYVAGSCIVLSLVY